MILYNLRPSRIGRLERCHFTGKLIHTLPATALAIAVRFIGLLEKVLQGRWPILDVRAPLPISSSHVLDAIRNQLDGERLSFGVGHGCWLR